MPDHLVRPVVAVDPDADVDNRRLQALESFREYRAALVVWLASHPADVRAEDVLEDLGLSFAVFRRVAEDLPS